MALATHAMGSQLLRRLSKSQLLESLRRQSAAPFHVIIWDSSPMRLAEAMTRLESAPDDSVYYASPERVFTSPAVSARSALGATVRAASEGATGLIRGVAPGRAAAVR